MLKKLVKYDLKWIIKTMSIFFIITLIVSILTRIGSNFNNSFVGNIIYLILKGASIACNVSLIINSIIRIWVRFRINIYKDESYLTHTLPVTKKTLYNSKYISSLLTIIISIIAVLICFLVAFLDKPMIDKLIDIFKQSNITFIFINILLTMIFELIYMMNCGLLGLIIGHKSNNNKMVKSVIIGIVQYFIVQFIATIIIFAIGLSNQNMNGLFNNKLSNDTNFETAVKSLMLIMNSVYAILIIAQYYIGKIIFKKGINVE